MLENVVKKCILSSKKKVRGCFESRGQLGQKIDFGSSDWCWYLQALLVDPELRLDGLTSSPVCGVLTLCVSVFLE